MIANLRWLSCKDKIAFFYSAGHLQRFSSKVNLILGWVVNALILQKVLVSFLLANLQHNSL